MTTKERVIRTSIKKVELNLKKVQALLDSDPLSEIIKIRKEAQELIRSETDNEALLSKIMKLNERQMEQYAIFEKMKDTNALTRRKVKLVLELDNLRHELYFIEKSQK